MPKATLSKLTMKDDPAGEVTTLSQRVKRKLRRLARLALLSNPFANRLGGAHQKVGTAKARPEHVAFTDELTKLHDRRVLSTRLEQAVARYCPPGRPFSLVDVDAFAPIGDEPARLAGDETDAAEDLVRAAKESLYAAKRDGEKCGASCAVLDHAGWLAAEGAVR